MAGQAIAAGNARVLSARLSDARHFWDNDRKTPLDEMAKELSKVTFHEKCWARSPTRSSASPRWPANWPRWSAPMPIWPKRAARLAKADLVSEMVYEFPELQGAMGRYYALDQGEDASVADAIKDHYKPQGPSDEVPTAPVSAGRGVGRQAGHAGRLLGDRRKADRLEGPVCAEAGCAGG